METNILEALDEIRELNARNSKVDPLDAFLQTRVEEVK